MKNKLLLLAGTATALIAAYFIAMHFYQKSEQSKLDELTRQNALLLVRDHSPQLGAVTSRVLLVEFLDPECEACREFYPFVKSLMSKHEGKIRLVIRYAPFHQNSKFAVRILEAARMQDKYWQTLEMLFLTQPQWGDHHNPQPDLIWSYLPKVGLDVEKIRKDMLDPAIEKIIEQDIADGKQVGAMRTPTFFINGKRLDNFGYEQLALAIEKEL